MKERTLDRMQAVAKELERIDGEMNDICDAFDWDKYGEVHEVISALNNTMERWWSLRDSYEIGELVEIGGDDDDGTEDA